MATEITLPRLGQGMESGVIVRWLKQEGDSVSKGEPLYELDTDKVTQEVEAEVDGVLQKIVVAEGEVDVGATIAVIETNGAEPASESNDGEEAKQAELEAASQPEATPAPEQEPPANAAPATEEGATEAPAATPRAEAGGGRLKASPLARRIARERGVDLASLTGTGPEGRILAEDVERAPAGAAPAAAGTAARAPVAAPGEVEVIQLSSIRKTIARRLSEAWTAPVFQLGVSADMTEVLALRETLVEQMAEGDAKPTVNDVFVKLAAAALVRHRPVNATFSGEEIQRHPAAHVGIAVAAPQGLVVPVVRDADRRTVQEIARARADLVGRARDNKLKLDDLQGGTFTISNLGMFGVEQFTAVLNPPQVAILAVGSVKDEAVVRDGQVVVRPIVNLVLTCDHRAIDGADGATFLQTLVSLVERPALAL
jgi:pyruvate dehydrogenase E2 component (dihydrolipoamide acetyltransferase)